MITVWGGATSRTLRVHWMLHELGLDYTPQLIGSRTGATQTDEFRALNPKEKIPVLIDDDLVLTESAAINTYLGDTYGKDSGVVPKPYSRERALYNQWCSFIQMELDAHTLYVIRKHRDLENLYGAAPQAINTAIAGFDKQVNVAALHLQNHQYLVGNTFTAADILLAGCIKWAQAYDIPVQQVLSDYASRQTARPAFKTAAALNFSISAGA